MNSAQEQRDVWRSQIAAVAPILVGLLVFGAVWVLRSAADDRHQHTVVLLSQNDGFLGAWENRNQAAELLAEDADAVATEGIEVELVARFRSTLDVVVTAADPTTAATVAEELADEAIAERAANTETRWRSAAEGHRATLADIEAQMAELSAQIDGIDDVEVRSPLERDLASLNESRLSMERQITDAEADLASAVAPLDYARLVYTVFLGWWIFSEWPEPRVFIGAAIIVAAAAYTLHRERVVGKAKQARRAKTIVSD